MFTRQKRASNQTITVFILVAFILSLSITLYAPEAQAAGSFTSATAPDGRVYKIYVPSGYQAGTAVPLVLMLPGCTQDPDQFATGTEMNTYAEQYNFIVAYPDQPTTANPNKCWNWFEPAHQARGSGEPKSLVGVVNHIKSRYSIDSNRVYVAGLSSGGAMAVILGATYPDVFAAIGVGSGLEYKAATSMVEAFIAMSNGGPDPVAQGNAAYNAMGSYKRVVPVIVFHGTADYTVATVNGHQVLSQWAQTNDRASDGSDNNNIDDVADETINGQVPGGRSYTRYVYKDSTTGQIVMEKYIVNSMGHAWSGGSSQGSYTDPSGPKASLLMWEFFMNHPMGGGGGDDTTPPVTTASPGGGTYSGSVTVTLTVNEAATTYYTTDGSTPTTSSLVYSGPITISSSTTLKFFSVDTAGNAETVKTEVYTITPPGSGTEETFVSIAAEDGYAGALVADGYSTTVHKIGDKGMFNGDTYRTILSFDTSSLPDSAVIKEAKLRIYRKSLSGTVSSIKADIVKGYFGTASTLAQADYNAAISTGQADAFTLSVPAANNGYTEVALPGSVLQYINKTGKTQFRLKGVTNIDFTSDVLEIYGGEDANYYPRLVVTIE